jgi:hypothetical protein
MNPKVLDKSFQHGRLSKANQFALAASIFFDDAMRSTDLADTYVTLAIHSGIAERAHKKLLEIALLS